ncbi:invasin [Gordonia desulfuricans]|uniref:Invasin n=1 Tax=Gordonia desulfuricans TaxID=89051 RepID=A0A7K3LQM9_9ACTN|nr:hypothetical protein [Gordonia desulfuricans]NDK90549.1 invasin [Gordonia desulfuricans]
MSGEFVVDPMAVDGIAASLESMAYDIESVARCDLTTTMAVAMPHSPMVAAAQKATDGLRQAQTAVSGQWETFAAAVRAVRTIAASADEENATTFAHLAELPHAQAPR